MVFRDYRPNDFASLCRIDQICFPPGIAYPPQDLSYWLKQPGTFAIVAEIEEKREIAGFILCRLMPVGRRHGPPHGHIVTIDILPEFRRLGGGKRLMELAHERLRQRGARRVRLETSVENAAAIEFFHGLGYETTRRVPRYYLDQIDAWLMIKELNH